MTMMLRTFMMLMLCRRPIVMDIDDKNIGKNDNSMREQMLHYAYMWGDIFVSAKTRRPLLANLKLHYHKYVTTWHKRRLKGKNGGKQEEGVACKLRGPPTKVATR